MSSSCAPASSRSIVCLTAGGVWARLTLVSPASAASAPCRCELAQPHIPAAIRAKSIHGYFGFIGFLCLVSSLNPRWAYKSAIRATLDSGEPTDSPQGAKIDRARTMIRNSSRCSTTGGSTARNEMTTFPLPATKEWGEGLAAAVRDEVTRLHQFRVLVLK